MISYEKLIQPKDKFGIPTFKHEDIGMKGINGNPFVGFDSIIGLTDNKWDELDFEIGVGLATNKTGIPGGMVIGEMPPKIAAETLGKLEPQIANNLDEIDPTGKHRSIMDKMTRHERQKYTYMVLGSTPIWHQLVYLRNYEVRKNMGHYEAYWTEEAKQLFPKVINFIETLPFKILGRVVIFCTYPYYPVPAHRDWIQQPHRDHHINFTSRFDRGIYVYDEIKDEKYYLDKNVRGYMFNLRDYHGVDACQLYSYTLKVEGIFTDKICDLLGLKDGFLYTNGEI